MAINRPPPPFPSSHPPLYIQQYNNDIYIIFQPTSPTTSSKPSIPAPQHPHLPQIYQSQTTPQYPIPPFPTTPQSNQPNPHKLMQTNQSPQFPSRISILSIQPHPNPPSQIHLLSSIFPNPQPPLTTHHLTPSSHYSIPFSLNPSKFYPPTFHPPSLNNLAKITLNQTTSYNLPQKQTKSSKHQASTPIELFQKGVVLRTIIEQIQNSMEPRFLDRDEDR